MLYKDTYHIKRLEDCDLKSLQSLILTVFKKKFSIEYLSNKYNTSYLNIKFICFIAYVKNTPVAFYGAIPQFFSNGHKNILVAHACDSFTVKTHQKKGLHFILAQKSYEVMRENGISLVYAFHSENTFYSTKKLGWKTHHKMARFHFKTHSFPIAKALDKLRINRLYGFIFNDEIPEDFYNLTKGSDKNKYQQKVDANFKL